MTVKFKKQNSILDSGECLRGLNLLGHAQLIELELGSTCGGHGKCGKDRIVISGEDLQKVNPPTEIEKMHLKTDQIARGMRLACQCFPNEDLISLSVAIPEK